MKFPKAGGRPNAIGIERQTAAGSGQRGRQPALRIGEERSASRAVHRAVREPALHRTTEQVPPRPNLAKCDAQAILLSLFRGSGHYST
ncbi:MAG TPA: hypothetical protein VKF40_21050 [Burkholderiales bacterium]|nr:hypothetical protein [Burkholderiales bacterium]